MDTLTASPPDEAALRWVARSVHPRATVGRVVALVGGISASVHACTVTLPSGGARELVLRRWVGTRPESAARRVERETALLRALADHAHVPAPELVAADARGDETGGVAAVLITRLPGQVHLTPADPASWLRQMAAPLPEIHALPIQARPMPRFDPSGFSVPSWTSRPDAWRRALELLSAGLDDGSSFVHHDFQHFNLLWSEERLSGIVDWNVASIGSPDVDVAHCRFNLALLFSVDWAEEFRLAYQAVAGRETDPRFDLAEIAHYGPGWKNTIPRQVGGRAPVDLSGMDARVDDLLVATLARC